MWRSMRSTSRRAKHSKHRRSSTSFIARPLPQPEILATSLPRYLATSSPVVWRPLLALSVPLLACAWHIVVVVVVVVVVGGAAKAPAARRDMSLLEALVHDDRGDAICVDHTLGIVCWYVRRSRGTSRAPCAAVVISNVGMHVHTVSISRSSYLLSRSRERVCVCAPTRQCVCVSHAHLPPVPQSSISMSATASRPPIRPSHSTDTLTSFWYDDAADAADERHRYSALTHSLSLALSLRATPACRMAHTSTRRIGSSWC